MVTEPAVEGQMVNPGDAHMEASPFSDPDGDAHLNTDWEIWTVAPAERVWTTLAIGGVERTHTHLGDGLFEGTHAGRSELLPNTDYELRVRYRDSEGSVSAYGTRHFSTGSLSEVFPLELHDIIATDPTFTDALGAPIVLPGGGAPGVIEVRGAADDTLLLRLSGGAAGNQVSNPAALEMHVNAQVRVRAGAAPLVLPAGRLGFLTDDGERTIYLPALNLPAGEERVLWVAIDGASYWGDASQTTPDFSDLAEGAAVPFLVLQPGYKVEVVAQGFQLPTNIAFVPNPGSDPDDPFYYVNELYGTIKVVTRDGTVHDYATDLLNFDPTGNFPGSGEQGLSGLAIDPATGDVFASMLYSSVPGTENAPHYPKVVRFHSTDGGITAATQTTILDMPGESMGQSHQISNVSIGPDGKLYVHVGDGFDSGTAQNLNSYRGKILRLNLDGTAPADNPHYNGGTINARDYVYAYGFRNPFGGAWRASDGQHYEVENGPSIDRFAKVERGENYLWDGSDASMQQKAIYNWSPATAPVNLAFVQPETFGGSGFPAEKQGHAFVSESGSTWGTGPQNGKRISEFVLNAEGDLVEGPTTLIEYGGSGKASVVALAAGPDGLYFSDFYKDQDYQTPIDRGARILRVRYVGTADFSADMQFGTPNLAVKFSDTSTVPNPTNWQWDFGDGHTSSERNPLHIYEAAGDYDVRLRVTGADGVAVLEKPGYVRVAEEGGAGLRAEYYDTINFSGPALVKTGAAINGDWGEGSPDAAIDPNTFSIRWTGQVTPQFSETYTFYTNTDDGVRLWVDGKLLIDRWIDQGPTEWSATVALTAGEAYDLKMEYYENGGGAVAQLRWSSPSRAKQIVPANRLSQPVPPNQPPRVLAAAFVPSAQGDRLEFTFHEDVGASLSPDDLQLRYRSWAPFAASDIDLTYDAAAKKAVFSFSRLPLGGLLGGIHKATLTAAGITDAAGAQLDGNADNIAGDAYEFSFAKGPNSFDLDGDYDLDLSDFGIFKHFFGQTGDVPGDLNGDAKIDLTDFGILKENFGKLQEDMRAASPLIEGSGTAEFIGVARPRRNDLLAAAWAQLGDEAEDAKPWRLLSAE
jgi:glucose/arabinose dehydrogenase